MGQRTLLLVEDEETLSRAIAYSLTQEGYSLLTATDGAQGLALARERRPDLVLLDIMLPSLNGFEVCRALRSENNVPVLMLTARTTETDKIAGFDLGADDYMTKPFSMRELLARVKALLRRSEMSRAEEAAPRLIATGELSLDVPRRQVLRRGAPVALRPKEFDLFAFLLQHPGLVFSRDTLLERVWGYDFAGGTRTVDVHMRWLREKVEDDPANPQHLTTVRGVGYRFEA